MQMVSLIMKGNNGEGLSLKMGKERINVLVGLLNVVVAKQHVSGNTEWKDAQDRAQNRDLNSKIQT